MPNWSGRPPPGIVLPESAQLVSAVVGEIDSFDVSEATVVILFLSAVGLAGVVTGLRDRLESGARIVADEQAPLALAADRSVPLFAPAGITAAIGWDVL